MMSFIEELARDTHELLEKAVVGKSVNAFGVDGFGKFGQSRQAFFFTVADITLDVYADNDDDIPPCSMTMFLNGYSSHTCGDICTDQNFRISLNNLLADANLRTDCWGWESINKQGGNYVCLSIDIRKLLNI